MSTGTGRMPKQMKRCSLMQLLSERSSVVLESRNRLIGFVAGRPIRIAQRHPKSMRLMYVSSLMKLAYRFGIAAFSPPRSVVLLSQNRPVIFLLIGICFSAA
jgi:hypothetical protein